MLLALDRLASRPPDLVRLSAIAVLTNLEEERHNRGCPKPAQKGLSFHFLRYFRLMGEPIGLNSQNLMRRYWCG